MTVSENLTFIIEVSIWVLTKSIYSIKLQHPHTAGMSVWLNNISKCSFMILNRNNYIESKYYVVNRERERE